MLLSVKYYTLLLFASFFITYDNSFLQERAREKHQNIAIYFSGSDWCSSCRQFKEKVLAQPAIDSLLKHGYVFYVADFPQRKKLPDSTRVFNDFLAEKLNPSGIFPAFILTDENLGIQHSQLGSKVAPEALLAKLKQHSR